MKKLATTQITSQYGSDQETRGTAIAVGRVVLSEHLRKNNFALT